MSSITTTLNAGFASLVLSGSALAVDMGGNNDSGGEGGYPPPPAYPQGDPHGAPD